MICPTDANEVNIFTWNSLLNPQTSLRFGMNCRVMVRKPRENLLDKPLCILSNPNMFSNISQKLYAVLILICCPTGQTFQIFHSLLSPPTSFCAYLSMYRYIFNNLMLTHIMSLKFNLSFYDWFYYRPFHFSFPQCILVFL